MMHREQFLKAHPNVKGEMVAYTRDGEKLGKITTLNEDSVNIEKGFFFPRDVIVSYDDITEVRDNEIVISRRGTELRDVSGQAEGGLSGHAQKGWDKLDALNRGGDVDIPLFEEELQVHKSSHKAGEVRIRKTVHTEEQSFTIPVNREEVVIEHIPAGESREASPDESLFSEQEMSIPLMEEDVELSKQQKIRETVHARKVTHTDERTFSGEVRKEDLEVGSTGESSSGKGGTKIGD